jgi:peptide chain release factor subunit 1
VEVLDSYGGYGVVLVDKQSARVFNFHLGELKEQDGLMGESVRRTKRGGGSQAAGRRGGDAGQSAHTDEVAERNIKDAVDVATRFFSDSNVRRILIGGTEDNVAFFRSQLPKSWQSLVVGTFPISMMASHSEVLDKAMEVGRMAEKKREDQLVKTLVTNTAKGREGVLGLDDTLAAIREGRVQTLLIRDGFRASGSRCSSCGYLTAQEMDTCPFCEGASNPVSDVVEVAVRQAMRAGGDIEVLQKEHETKGFEQIGALLRY